MEGLLSGWHLETRKNTPAKRCKRRLVEVDYSSTSSTTSSSNITEGENKALTATGEDDVRSEGQQMFAEAANNQQLTEYVEYESDEEDKICPICLLEIVEGEDLVECVNGCHIELHRHCMEICKEISSACYCIVHSFDKLIAKFYHKTIELRMFEDIRLSVKIFYH